MNQTRELKRALEAFQTRQEKKNSKARARYETQQRKRKLVGHLLDRDGPKCFYCYKDMDADVTIEHLKERSRGGTDAHDNLRLAHQKCNQAVIGKSVVEKLNICLAARSTFKLDK